MRNYSGEDVRNYSHEDYTHNSRVYFVVVKGNKESEKEVVGGGGSEATIGEVLGGDANGSRDIRVAFNIKQRLSGKKVLEGRGLMLNANKANGQSNNTSEDFLKKEDDIAKNSFDKLGKLSGAKT